MYIPANFVETNLSKLHEFIEQHSFGLLLSIKDREPFGTHVPFLLDRNTGTNGALIGHMARANSQWEQLDGEKALAVFSGPHAYISPTWYEAEHVVPTWNYVAVHVYGKVRIITQEEQLLEIVRKSVQVYESKMPKPWSLDETSTFTQKLLNQIVGFQIEIERIEGKWKLNQNHSEDRRKKVIQALALQGDENARAISELMEQTLTES